MTTENISSFHLIGIEVRTTNENGQSGTDIPALWNTFMSQGLPDKIPSKIDNSIYCIYTDYEKDHTRPYTTVLGCKVADLTNIPEGMVGRTFENGQYQKHIAKGNLLEGIVFAEWMKIWNSAIPRIYTADIEVYGEKAMNPENAEVDIYLAV